MSNPYAVCASSFVRPAGFSVALAAALIMGACGSSDGRPTGMCGTALCDLVDAGTTGTDGGSTGTDSGTMAAPTGVVDTTWLADHLTDANLQVVDAREAGSFAAGHIPGSLHVDVSTLRATVGGIGGQVAPASTGASVLSAAGVDPSSRVVVYGATTDTTSARLVWTLEYYGQTDVQLLDGGWIAWSSTQTSMETGPATPTPTSYAISGTVDELRVDAAFIASRLDDDGVVLVDARSSGEYGAGHIPGALSIDWMRNVSASLYRPMDDVAALYADIDRGATVVAYCQTGSRASVAYVTLRWLGFADVRLYDGSWAEWGSRSDLPKEP